jgi:hypothetical protein
MVLNKDMIKIELIPDLENCIETIARREHASTLNKLLKPGRTDKELEEKLETLRIFLETADFKQLRAESEKKLAEGKKVEFTVYLDDGVKYEMREI